MTNVTRLATTPQELAREIDAVRSGAPRKLRLGIIASELPPELGGMQEHARGLLSNLALDHELLVYTARGRSLAPSSLANGDNIVVHPVLTWSKSRDLAILEQAPVDAWITLNAGLACYSLGLSKPVFAYVYGNDFTRPWLPYPERPVRLARRLLGERIVTRWRANRLAAGLRRARWVFAISDFSRALCVREHGITHERMSVVPPGIRPEFFHDSSPSDSSRLRLASVSRLTTAAARKNIDGVIEAIALLKHEIPIRYTVIGDGDDKPRLQALAQRLGVADDVHFLGAVGTQRVVEEFCRNDALIMPVKPSGGDVEGFGMVFAEAAATGLPSIGARIGGIPEVIKDGVTGLLLDDVTAEGISAGVRQFHARREDFDRDAIRKRAEQFSAAHCSAMIAQTISSMV